MILFCLLLAITGVIAHMLACAYSNDAQSVEKLLASAIVAVLCLVATGWLAKTING